MQRTEEQDVYTRITNQIVSHLEKGVRPGFSRGMPNTRQDGLRAHSATTGSLTAESTFSLCGKRQGTELRTTRRSRQPIA